MAGTGRTLRTLADGTVKQVSPITGTVVWTVPGRSHRPLPSPLPQPRPLAPGEHDSACAFCPTRYLETPPEKSRLLLDERGRWRIRAHLTAEEVSAQVADFRRIPNLFEILGYDYWHANHGYEVPVEVAERAHRYASTPAGRAHLLAIARTRMAAAGATAEDVAAASTEHLLAAARRMFAGSHDVVVARRHFVDGAGSDADLCSSGDLSPEEHVAYLALSVDTLRDLATSFGVARYVAVFQNWLRPAGASFDHLHKQLVAIDEHGPLLTRELGMLAERPELYNEAVVDPATRDRLVIAQSDHALALAGVGHRYPTVEVWSTGAANRPWEHDDAALRGVSDLLHACHAATGRLVATNEEWHYRPVDVDVAMPWRINLKWRISTLAGFEGGTKINVNTISPFALRDRMVTALRRLHSAGRIAPMAIGDECRHASGALRYTEG
jgi:galactose-1-phosphate uridylyltransferase